jgi:hypothetical protein
MNARARTVTVGLAMLGAVLLGGCAAQSSSSQPGNPQSSDSQAGTPAPVHSSSAVDRAVVTVDEHANDTTVRVVAGVDVVLTLHSTYWMDFGSSRPAVVREDGQPGVQPSHCIPGGGCGQVRVRFTAVQPGTAVVEASRVSCGEALACGSANGHYRVTIIVTH